MRVATFEVRDVRKFKRRTVSAQCQKKWAQHGSRATKIVMLAFCCYYTFNFLVDYFKYPTIMTLHIGGDDDAEFPTVTLCNANRIRKTYFCKRASENGSQSLKWRLMESSSALTRKICNRGPNFEFEDNKLSNFNCDSAKSQTLPQFMALYDFGTLLNPEEKANSSQDAAQFFQHCMFDSERCSHINFTRVDNAIFGRNCFRSHFSLQSISYGYISGLYLLFNLDAYEYLKAILLLNSMGINAHVSYNRNITVKLNSDVFKIAPGRNTVISMKQIAEKRLPPPYIDNCRDYKDGSRIGCQDECWNKLAMEKCGCKDPLLNFQNEDGVCDLNIRQKKCCLYDVRNTVMSKKIDCDCAHACS